jgi:hypothetical protein
MSRSLLTSLVATGVMALPLSLARELPAQGAAPSVTPIALLPEAEEVALARSAAPADVSAKATIYVLRRDGFAKVVEGTNGCACLVGRDSHPESRYPICFNVEATRTILSAFLKEHELRLAGRTEPEVEAEIARLYGGGAFRLPAPPAMSYMMSSRQVLFTAPGPEGRRVGAWYPHVMIYLPYARLADFGLPDGARGELGVGDPGLPTAHLVVKVRQWADSAAAGAR